jgi:hypothetical protein
MRTYESVGFPNQEALATSKKKEDYSNVKSDTTHYLTTPANGARLND